MTLVKRNNHPLFSNWLSWDPFAEFNETRRAVGFRPSFDIVETEDAYLVKADMPGLEHEDLDITFHEGTLSINGTRQEEVSSESDKRHVLERRYGEFSRAFTLPEGVDAESIEANLTAGVLTVSIKKKEQIKPVKVQIKG